MDVCRRLSHSSSASSVDTNHSSWSIIGDDGEDVDDYEFVSINDFYEDERDDYEFISNPQDLCEWRKMDKNVESSGAETGDYDENSESSEHDGTKDRDSLPSAYSELETDDGCISEEESEEEVGDEEDEETDEDKNEDGDNDENDDEVGDDDDGNNNDNDDDVGDEDNDIDDDMYVVSEDDVLVDTAAANEHDASRNLFNQLNNLSRTYDSPFNRLCVRALDSERNLELIVFLMTLASFLIFLPIYTINEPKSIVLDGNFCAFDEDRYSGLQFPNSEITPLRPSVELPLKPSLSWPPPPSDDDRPGGSPPFTRSLSAGSNGFSLQKRLRFNVMDATVQQRYTTMQQELVKKSIFSNIRETVKSAIGKSGVGSNGEVHSELQVMNLKTPLTVGSLEPPSKIQKSAGASEIEKSVEIPKIHEPAVAAEVEKSAEIPKIREPVGPPEVKEFLKVPRIQKPAGTPDIAKPVDFLETQKCARVEKPAEASVIQQFPSTIKPTLPIPPFSPKHSLTEPKTELLLPNSSVPLQTIPHPVSRQHGQKFPKAFPDLPALEEPCAESLPGKEKADKEVPKPRHANDLAAFIPDLSPPEGDSSKKSEQQNPAKNRKAKRTTGNLTSEPKKKIAKSIAEIKARREKLMEFLQRTIEDMVTQKHQKKVALSEVVTDKKKIKTADDQRCVRNSTCSALASFARTLSGIKHFSKIVGHETAAKYIDSLTDLSACIDKRLMCEKCWWTKDCCFKEKCKIRSWQRHFSTKRFVLKHYDKLMEAFRALGWPMPQRKRKGDDGEVKFEPNHPSRPAGSMKKMYPRSSWENVEQSDWYCERIQERADLRKASRIR